MPEAEKAPDPKESEAKKPEEKKEVSPELAELQKKFEELSAKNTSLEKAAHDTKADHTRVTQQLAEMKKAQEAAARSQTMEGFLDGIKETAENEGTVKAITDGLAALAYQSQQQYEQLNKAREADKAEIDEKILRGNPETAQIVDTVKKLEGVPLAEQVKMLEGLYGTKAEDAAKAAAQEDLVVAGGNGSRRVKHDKSDKELFEADSQVQRLKGKLGYRSTDDLVAAKKRLTEQDVAAHFTGEESR
jgi:hypothetical protein